MYRRLLRLQGRLGLVLLPLQLLLVLLHL